MLLTNILNMSKATIIHNNSGTKDKFYWKLAFLTYTEMFHFRPQSLKAALKPKLHGGLGTRLPSVVLCEGELGEEELRKKTGTSTRQ